MEGFPDGLNGFFDTDDQLSRYLLRRADERFTAGGADGRAVDSREGAERRRERVREFVRSRVGGMPDGDTAFDAETTGRIERDGYSIELVVLESRPDFHVTANCYVPDGEGPHPAVLFLCGHVDAPKADEENQWACIDLALNGFVVCIVDPIGQGERRQYPETTVEGTTVSGGGTFPHCYAGQKCFYAGTTLARYMLADSRRALEYLLGRDDVDGDRVGATGASGGGTQAIHLSVLDDRVAAAAPCCSITDHRDRLRTGRRLHGEQVLPGAIADGIGYDDLLGAIAPRPVCISAAASDEYFPIEGLYDVAERVERIYDRYGGAENLSVVVGDTTHCSVYELRDGVLGWLCERLGAGEYEPHDDRPILDEPALQCTPDGNVLESIPDERTVEDLLRERLAGSRPGDGAELGDDEGVPDQLRRTLVEAFDLDRPDCTLHPRVTDRTTEDGLDVEYVCFKSERRPDIVVAGVLVTEPGSAPETPAVVLYERGTAELPDRDGEVAALARKHGAAFVFDPRGVGAVRNRALTVPTWWEGYYGIYGTEFKLATDALLLGSSLLGMRVYDVGRAVEFLRSETGAAAVSFVGDGVGAYHTLYAAAVTERVNQVALRNLGPSFHELATKGDAPFYPQLAVFDVIGTCDVPRVTAALEQQGVRVDRDGR